MIRRLRFALAEVMMIALVAVSWPVAPASAESGWAWPVLGDVITTYKNGSDPYAAGQHRGIDIASPVGTAVHASVGGNVTYAGHLPDGGITATVQSSYGRYLVSYLHLSELAVKRGDSIGAGGLVGNVGVTGKRSAVEPHLHFGVRLASSGAYIDPLPLLGPRPVAQTPAADSPAAAQPVEHVAPQAKAKANGQAHMKAESPSQPVHRTLPKHATARAHHPQSVHVPASGDSVSAQTIHPHSDHAADSARESHASTGKATTGRVAPPPLPVAQPQAVNLASPGREPATTEAAAAKSRAHGSTTPLVVFAFALASLAAWLIRRRPRRDSEFTPPPLAHREDLKSPRGPTSGEVVEIHAAKRRA